MLDVAEAPEIVLRHAKRLSPRVGSITSATLGQVLAEDVRADIDSPPFAKSLMDGYAVRAADVAAGAELRVVEEVPAGDGADEGGRDRAKPCGSSPGRRCRPGRTRSSMQEKTDRRAGDRVRFNDPTREAGPARPAPRQGDAGRRRRRAGRHGPHSGGDSDCSRPSAGRVSRVPAPRLSVLATGNELVEADATPGPGQIRNSNGPMLIAQAARAGAVPRYLGIARDDEGQLADAHSAKGCLQPNVLVLAGGVSAGKLDLVPKVLADLGVEDALPPGADEAGQAAAVRDDGATCWCSGCRGTRSARSSGSSCSFGRRSRHSAGTPTPGRE